MAMSGGVDSLCAALLLLEQGHEVVGLHMLLPRFGQPIPNKAAEALRSVVERLGVPLHVVDMRQSFEELVIKRFLEDYRRGRTPNPCVHCNAEIKFGLLLREALRHGADYLATGHYARVLPPGPASDRYRLLKGRDPGKDQSYFLYRLSQEQLRAVLFPLGERLKEDVLRRIQRAGLVDEVPQESQEICFLPSGNYQDFIAERIRAVPEVEEGPVVDSRGNRIGTHRGLFAYTVGQRRGLGIPSSAPYYVIAMDPSANTLIVGRSDDLYASRFLLEDLNWVSIPPPTRPLTCLVRIRNQHDPAPAEVVPITDETVTVRFDQPQRAITPGQSAVFYQGETVLGGGVIGRVFQEKAFQPDQPGGAS